jgi:hypothetical protein
MGEEYHQYISNALACILAAHSEKLFIKPFVAREIPNTSHLH